MAYCRLLICILSYSLLSITLSASQNGIREFKISAYPSCGITNPAFIYDCTNSSTDKNSCCYYSYGALTGCFMLDFVSQSTLSPGKLTITCGESITKVVQLMLILIVILLLI